MNRAIGRAPGKLFIAGEYAVVNPAYPAILVAVDRFITVDIEETVDEGTIISEQYAHLPLKWKRVNNRLQIEKRDNPFHYILEAIDICEHYAFDLGRSLKVYNLTVKSELDSRDGAKYGLGSSAAVTIATLRALLQLYDIAASDVTVFKLACLAHLKLGSNGSFGDLAASTATGWIAYACFDRKWVLKQQETMSLLELLSAKWPSLMLKRLNPPDGYRLLIAWTKKPASTASLVDRVSQEVEDEKYQTFLDASRAVVTEMIDGFNTNDGNKVCRMLAENRRLLRALYPSIETPQLTKLIELAVEYGTGKSSGAGGGDCGIVMVPTSLDITALVEAWKDEDIIPLSLNVYDKRATDSPSDWV